MDIGKIKIDFKPEFGNPDHVRVLQMMDEIQENLKILSKKEEAKLGAAALKKEINEQAKELQKFIKFIKSKEQLSPLSP